MSNQANANAQTSIKGFDVEKLKDEEIIKLEQEMKAKLELLQKAKIEREEKIKTSALTEIKTAIDKVLSSQVVTASELTAFLVSQGYVTAPKTVAESGSGKAGRRAINDEDLLFSMQYTSEDSKRSQTLKLDALSTKPAPNSGASKFLATLQDKSFDELKSHFTPKFFEFIKTDESFRWVETFFPKLQSKIDELVKAS